MERGPHTEADSLEQVDLFEAFSDIEVTIFGKTGTFGSLAEQCPVDLSDPRISLDMKNNFIVKVANEAGIAIDQKYEKQFNETLEKHSLERKFTIAPKVEAEQPMSPEAVKQKPAVQTEVAKAPEKPDVPRVVTPRVRELDAPEYMDEKPRKSTPEIVPNQTVEVPAKAVAHTAIAEVIDLETVRQARRMDELLRTTLQRETPVAPDAEWHASEAAASDRPQPIEAQITAEVTQPHEAPTEAEAIEAFTHDFATEGYDSVATEATEENPNSWSQSSEVMYTDAPLVEHDSDGASNREADEQLDAAQVLAVELTKEPVELYGDFMAASERYLMSSSEDQESDDPIVEIEQIKEVKDFKPLAMVVEAMQSVDDDAQPQVAETVQQLVGAVHGLAILESRPETPAEITQEVEARIVGICEQLCTRLGVELGEEQIRQIVFTIRQPDFIAGFKPLRAERAMNDDMHEQSPGLGAVVSLRLPHLHPSRILSRLILGLSTAA